MERKTKIDEVKVFLMPEKEGWRVKFSIASSVGEREDLDHFEALVVFPIKEIRLTPDELKLRAFDHFKSVFKDVSAILEKGSFDSLWPEDYLS